MGYLARKVYVRRRTAHRWCRLAAVLVLVVVAVEISLYAFECFTVAFFPNRSLPINGNHRCSDGNFRFGSYYTDSMLLQGAPLRPVVWGYARKIGDHVDVLVDDVKVESTAAFEGPEGLPVWRLHLHAPNDTLAHNITATSGGCEHSLRDVMFGDMWLCVGDDHLQRPLVDSVASGSDVISSADPYPNIRVLSTGEAMSRFPLYEPEDKSESWRVSDTAASANFSSTCWQFGQELSTRLGGAAIGLIQITSGASTLQAWAPPEALETCKPTVVDSGNDTDADPNDLDSQAWNAMLHPYLRMTIKGVIMQQDNLGTLTPDQYGCLLPEVVTNWRQTWNRITGGKTDITLPIGLVRVTSRGDGDVDQLPALRWAQTGSVGYLPNDRMKNVFLAETIDVTGGQLATPGVPVLDSHVTAQRLALGAYHVANGMTEGGSYQGPFPTDLARNGSELRVIYDGGETHLTLKNGSGFEVCCHSNDTGDVCADAGVSTWVAATVVRVADSEAVIEVPCGLNATLGGVRYAWAATGCVPPAGCAIYRAENDLPASPYIWRGSL